MKKLKKIEELFRAQASSPSETAILYNGVVGFRIPEYQREYDWSKENIERLFYDCLGGFFRLSTSANADAFTFLGTIILVEEKAQEKHFAGKSISVVDGQQRLTTLTLIACALYERLKIQMEKINTIEIKNDVKDWLIKEIEDRLKELSDCAYGWQQIKGNKFHPYPRIIRSKDYRAPSVQDSEYSSPLGKFLEAFSFHYNKEEENNVFIQPALGSGSDAKKLGKNYELIRELVENINNLERYEDIECEYVPIKKQIITRPGYKALFERFESMIGSSDSERDRALDVIDKCSDIHDLIRTLLFSAYFCCCIVLTRVTTDDEGAAFDIFDALNTTGEPLTALETLKPRVMQNEDVKLNFLASPSGIAFRRIKENLDDYYIETSKKQLETKELLVSFALYIKGVQLPKHLAAQRRFLRGEYDSAYAISIENGRRFISSIADMTEFRRYYWTEEGIREELGRFHLQSEVDNIRLYMSFIRSMKTSLTLPILARYWSSDRNCGDNTDFIDVLKAVTAFLILRRAASGGTAGIDGDFRSIMASGQRLSKRTSYGLCAGVQHQNRLLTLSELKTAFRELLASSRYNITDQSKDKWIDMVASNPLYRQAKPLVRFLLLIAADQSITSPQKPGCWEKHGVRDSPHNNNLFDYKTWHGELYETVEHIAPDSHGTGNWDSGIYNNPNIRHSIGNLILLPSKENAAIGNAGWERKKVFYRALTERRIDQLQERLDEVQALGMPFPKSTKQLLHDGKRLALLDPLRDVDTWNPDIIEARGRNIAELAWNRLWPWLE